MERVQFQQEQMLHELKDLVEKSLFTEKEVKEIMKRRTSYETALVRRVAKKGDFLRYISYEMGLEQLRRKRVERMKIPPGPATISDYALVRRQFHIFERAVKKFKSDVGLWVQYIEVAKREKADALVGRIIARALQLHPQESGLYIMGAAHELDQMSASGARTLLQRGIRINGDSIDLWTEYVKMEMGFIERLRRRWEVLGVGMENEEVMSGGIVETVITNALEAIPSLDLEPVICGYPCPESLRQRLMPSDINIAGLVPLPLGAESPPMLQYPVQLPPLSLSSSKHPKPNDLLNRNRPILSRQLSSPISSSPSPRSPYISSRHLPPPLRSSSSQSSILSQPLHDVLAPGDTVGEGSLLQGEPIRLVSSSHTELAREFEVIKQLGTGSYAVVYLVQEVLSRPVHSEDGHMSTIGLMELDTTNKPVQHTVYGREYAIKCLSKADLDQDALAVQMSEVHIHQSLHLHPNIVTLHHTFETSAFLLLLLEYVPGEDLFFFLEQSRDHYDLQPTDSSVSPSHTPPTPSLLSNLHPSLLLSRTRLRLISSMFSQMCDAVAACHAQQVFHRDIKPENFIVTDAIVTTSDGRRERKVVVKLTDFGLSTTDVESCDMDCGSAPYMSYECRNNVAPTYRPRAADVWSLGIVLINMLYHYNPWTDTAQGACSSFDLFRRDPVNFFLTRFTGMTKAVADVLANNVFCIFDDPTDDSRRMSAAEFGSWVKNLPTLLGGHGMHRTMSNSSTQGHRLSLSIPISHKPSSRRSSLNTPAVRTPAMPTRSLSRAPSLEPPFEREGLSTVIDNEDEVLDEDIPSRSTSNTKRRKRGARKGKSVGAENPIIDETLVTLAVASQSLAREISRASKPTSLRTVSTKTSSSINRRKPYEPVSLYAMPTALLKSTRPPVSNIPTSTAPAPPPPAAAPSPAPVTKKPSKWKLSFGKNSSSTLASAAAPPSAGRVSPLEEASPTSIEFTHAQPMSAIASNVTSLIMGLDAPPNPRSHAVGNVIPSNATENASSTWTRGRRGRESQESLHGPQARTPAFLLSDPVLPQDSWSGYVDKRAISPNSTRSSIRPCAAVGSSASSVISSNWRSSMSSTATTSSAGTSTSAFTRYSNSSARSISTTATSVSSTSWRTSVKPVSTNNSAYPQGNIPKNIKIMDHMPWVLNELPRSQHSNPVGDIFGSPPVRKQRTRKSPKDLKLDTITERPTAHGQRSPENLRRDASTSTTDLGNGFTTDVDGVKKVQKGQINALAKMLSALRR